MATSREHGRLGDRGGFTLVELLISLTVGLVLVAASLSFAISTFRGAEGNKLREEVYRNARFINMSLQRDVQSAGVGIESSVNFGTVSTFGDTLVILSVPWEPTPAPAYTINTASTPAPGTGTCGPLCIGFDKSGGTFDLAPGDLARLQVNQERRLLLITAVRDVGTTFQITFLGGTTFLNYASAFAGSLQLDPVTTTVQKLRPIIYFEGGDSVLYRAQSFDNTGAMIAAPMAYGVVAWDAQLVFTDLDVADAANISDGDVTNDFDDLLGVRIRTTLSTNRADLRVNEGQLFTRDYEWRIMPRNLMYERNR